MRKRNKQTFKYTILGVKNCANYEIELIFASSVVNRGYNGKRMLDIFIKISSRIFKNKNTNSTYLEIYARIGLFQQNYLSDRLQLLQLSAQTRQ